MKIYRYFSKEDYALDFLNNGYIRFLPFSAYRKMEDMSDPRVDEHDGRLFYSPKYKKNDSIIINDKKLSIAGPIKIETGNHHEKYIAVSCYSKSNSIAKFGKFCIIINDVNEFIGRIENYFEKYGLFRVTHDHVYYYDTEKRQDHNYYFCKKRKFEDEEEYRFCIDTKDYFSSYLNKDGLKLLEANIGSLKDIASIKYCV